MNSILQSPFVQVALPLMFTILIAAWINSKALDTINKRIDELRCHMDTRFDAVNTRFDDMRGLWRAELGRVEEVIDARLKHLEER